MNRRFAIFVFIVLTGWSFRARAADVVDRIIASVNGHVILQSDWEDALHYEAFVDGHPVDMLPDETRKATLDHLIDQELLREQMHATDYEHATDQEVSERIAEIRKQYADAETTDGWNAVLTRYGFSEAGLRQRVALQIDLMRLVDTRLRPNVNIDSKSIESYYEQELLPQLRQSGAQNVALAEVTPKIKELLTQQRVNELLVAWLQNLRSGSDITMQPADPSGGELR